MKTQSLPKLFCTLKNSIRTRDGDFVPAGTPVQVIGWADNGEWVEVRADAYMYADSFDMESVENRENHGCVGRGLWLSVAYDELIYQSCENSITFKALK